MRAFFNRGSEKINTVLQRVEVHTMGKSQKRALSPKTESKSVSVDEKPIFYLMIDQDLFVEKKILTRSNVFLAQNNGTPAEDLRLSGEQRIFEMDNLKGDAVGGSVIGPMNFSSIIQFLARLESEIKLASNKEVIFLVEPGDRALSNAVFLLGAYMMLKLDYKPLDLIQHFTNIDQVLVTRWVDCDIKLIDCWGGLKRAQELGWIAMAADSSVMWGQINKAEYEKYSDPFNGDLHQVIPQKFIAFKGPKNLGGNKFFNNYLRGTRDFSPEYLVDTFRELDVSTVLRLNEAQYDAKAFVSKGISHHELSFEDCTSPPPAVIGQFFKVVDKSKGLIAVHCRTGLGQTPTLIALYLMRSHGFSAMQAIAWLRIMRPGSIGPEQQRFLVSVESAFGNLASSMELQEPLTNASPRKLSLANAKSEQSKHVREPLNVLLNEEANPSEPLKASCPRISEQIREELDRAERWTAAQKSTRRGSMTMQKSFTAKAAVASARDSLLLQRSFQTPRTATRKLSTSNPDLSKMDR